MLPYKTEMSIFDAGENMLTQKFYVLAGDLGSAIDRAYAVASILQNATGCWIKSVFVEGTDINFESSVTEVQGSLSPRLIVTWLTSPGVNNARRGQIRLTLQDPPQEILDATLYPPFTPSEIWNDVLANVLPMLCDINGRLAERLTTVSFSIRERKAQM